jgi:hypothetical protein
MRNVKLFGSPVPRKNPRFSLTNRITKKSLVKTSVADPGCSSRIPDPDFYPSRIPDQKTAKKKGETRSGIRKKPIPDPGSRGQKAPNPGSRIRIRNTGKDHSKINSIDRYMTRKMRGIFLVERKVSAGIRKNNRI